MYSRPIGGFGPGSGLKRRFWTPGEEMARIVMKFGGTSVADVEHLRYVADRVAATVNGGNEVAVVLSAMAGTTNMLIDLTREMCALHDAREYDSVVSTGEQITIGLLAMALQERGIQARSWMGWQLPIRTDGVHGSARIEDIDGAEIARRMGEGEVAVVAGFQGLSPNSRVTTLGRGGSDITAVALAAALGADRCDIHTDVDGVFTADPRIVTAARKLDRITYEEMLEMASQGAKVLQTRSVELAMNHRVRVQVLSSFHDAPGTLVVDEDEIVEQAVVSGITYASDEAKVTLLNVSDRPGVAAAIFGPLADANVNVDMIVQSASPDGTSTDMTFTVGRAELPRVEAILAEHRDAIGFKKIITDGEIVKVSVIGVGMRSHAGVAQRMFAALSEKQINIHAISTSEIKISVLIGAEYTELAVRSLHSAYGLDAA